MSWTIKIRWKDGREEAIEALGGFNYDFSKSQLINIFLEEPKPGGTPAIIVNLADVSRLEVVRGKESMQ